MRIQKIRGHKRIQKQIENWRLRNLEFRFDLLENYKKDHIDIVVHPWCDLSIINSIIPQPHGKTKQLMINALIDIYDSWKKQLDAHGLKYYLKVWLYEERFTKSQIVCAIDSKIDFYNNTFSKSSIKKNINPESFGNNKRLGEFNWELMVDEDFYDNNTVGDPEEYETIKDFYEMQRWFNRQLKKPHNKYVPDKPTEDFFEYYGFVKGKVWVGEKR
jgi:hypothetical protein